MNLKEILGDALSVRDITGMDYPSLNEFIPTGRIYRYKGKYGEKIYLEIISIRNRRAECYYIDENFERVFDKDLKKFETAVVSLNSLDLNKNLNENYGE